MAGSRAIVPEAELVQVAGKLRHSTSSYSLRLAPLLLRFSARNDRRPLSPRQLLIDADEPAPPGLWLRLRPQVGQFSPCALFFSLPASLHARCVPCLQRLFSVAVSVLRPRGDIAGMKMSFVSLPPVRSHAVLCCVCCADHSDLAFASQSVGLCRDSDSRAACCAVQSCSGTRLLA